jgi:tetratricopeptide (TPR) repeat protein
MTFRGFLHTAAYVGFVALAGYAPITANAETEESANSLLVRSIELWQKAEAIDGHDLISSQTRLELLESVHKNMKEVVSVHSGSDLALSLIIGEQIGPLSLSIAEEAKLQALRSHQLALCVANPTRECAFALAVDLTLDKSSRVGVFPIIEGFSQIGNFEEAIKFADNIESEKAKQLAYEKISTALAKAGQFEKAQDVAYQIRDVDYLGSALAEIVDAMTKAGKYDAASRIAKKIAKGNNRRDAIMSISNSLANNGNFDAAFRIADELDDHWQSIASRNISSAQLEAGHVQAAWNTALSIKDPGYLVEAGIQIAASLEKEEIVQELISFARGIESPIRKESALRTVGVHTQSSALLAEARAMAIKADDDMRLWWAAIEEIDAGLLSEAALTAENIDDLSFRSELFERLSEIQIKIGMTTEARGNLYRLTPERRLKILARLWSVEGDSSELDKALQLARSMEDEMSISLALADIISRTTNAERLEEAEHIAANIPNVSLRDYAYLHIVEVYSSAGLHTDAFEVLHRIADYRKPLVNALIVAGIAIK